MFKAIIAVLIVFSCGNGVAARCVSGVFQNDGCPEGLRETLQRGGFSGEVFCDKPNAEFSLVGVAHTSAAKYTVYDYRYRFLPEGGTAWHGGQRIIILRNNEYLGQFVLSGPRANVKLRGTKLTLSKPDVEPVSVDLTNGVPSSVLFDGDVMHFER
jgi:hypothetical protein